MSSLVRDHLVTTDFSEYQDLRARLMDVLGDDDLEFRLGGDTFTLGQLCREMGEVEHSYIEALKTFRQDFDWRNPDPLIERSVAALTDWFADLDRNLEAAIEAVTGDDAVSRRIVRADFDPEDFSPLPSRELDNYREALLIFYGKASIYLRAMGRELPRRLAHLDRLMRDTPVARRGRSRRRPTERHSVSAAIASTIVAMAVLASCAGNSTSGTPMPSGAQLVSISPAVTPGASPSPTPTATPTAATTQPPTVPAADYRIAPPHTLAFADDPTQVMQIQERLSPLLGLPAQAMTVGLGEIDEETFPANLIVIRFPSEVLHRPDDVERVVKRLTVDGSLNRIGTFSVRGDPVLVDRVPCVGEMDPGSVCFVAAYSRGDDFVEIQADSTKPMAKARALLTALITATQ